MRARMYVYMIPFFSHSPCAPLIPALVLCRRPPRDHRFPLYAAAQWILGATQAPPAQTPLTGASVWLLEQASSVRGLRRRATPDCSCSSHSVRARGRSRYSSSKNSSELVRPGPTARARDRHHPAAAHCASQRLGTHCTHACCASSEHRHSCASISLGRTLTLCSADGRPLSGLAADATRCNDEAGGSSADMAQSLVKWSRSDHVTGCNLQNQNMFSE